MRSNNNPVASRSFEVWHLSNFGNKSALSFVEEYAVLSVPTYRHARFFETHCSTLVSRLHELGQTPLETEARENAGKHC